MLSRGHSFYNVRPVQDCGDYMSLENKVGEIARQGGTFRQCLRSAAKLGLIAILGLASASCTQPHAIQMPRTKRVASGEITEANRLLREFPTKIPGGRIRKLMTPGAKYCLVHIREKHLYDDSSNLREFEAVQDDIYKAISFLKENYGVQGVHLEGVTSGNMDYIESILAKLKGQSPNVRREYTLNATFRLASQGSITIYPGDDHALMTSLKAQKTPGMLYGMTSMENIVKSYNRSPSKSRWKHNFSGALDGREDALLSQIHKKPPHLPLAITVFGQGHVWGYLERPHRRVVFQRGAVEHYSIAGFGDGENKRYSTKDNIRAWNQQHPDAKFSLIEITPLALDKP